MQRLLSCLGRGRGLSHAQYSSLDVEEGRALVVEESLFAGSDVVCVDDVVVDVAATVLIVEDATVNRRVMIKLFKSLGQTVEGVGNGQEAVNKIKRRMALQLPPYDAILMDLTMVSVWIVKSELLSYSAMCPFLSSPLLHTLPFFVVFSSPSWTAPPPPAPSAPSATPVASSASRATAWLLTWNASLPVA
jgi:hypothetical protein